MSRRHQLTAGAWMVPLIAIVAWTVRTWLPFGRIFSAGFINIQGDGWYHMRVVDNLVHNYPHRLTVDPYAASAGQYVGVAPLFDLLIATVALVAGLGHPSARTVEIVGAVLPAVLGTIAVVLVYLIGRRLFDGRAGRLAAALLAVMPGPFLDRTLLGATDHHAAETTLVLCTLLFLIAAVQAARAADRDGWEHRLAPWLAGASLGAYFLTWTSAPFFAFGLAVWLVVQFTIDQWRARSTRELTRIAITVLGTALAIVLLFQNPGMFRYAMQVAALGGFLALALCLHGIEIVARRATVPRAAILFAPLGVVMLVVAIAAALHPAIVGAVVEDVLRLQPDAASRSVSETQPLLFLEGRFSLLFPWAMFGPTFYLALPALVVLGVRVVTYGDAAETLLLAWGSVTLIATLGQNRFGYYLAPMIAVFAGWTASSLFGWAARQTMGAQWRTDVASAAIAAVIFYPSLRPGLQSVRHDDGMPPPWREALVWLRDHTPDPFGDPSYYLARYDAVPRLADYTVMNWWDYGYWIIRLGRRVPVTNPTQTDAWTAAAFFTATDEEEALKILREQRSRYVVADRELILVRSGDGVSMTGKFQGVVSWTPHPASEFLEVMFERGRDGRAIPVWLFNPSYYRSMAARLYLFGGRAAEPANSSWVVTYAERRSDKGEPFREIVEAKRFLTYDAADTYLQSLGPGPHRLVGLDPLKSPVPIAPLTGLRLLHDATVSSSSQPAVRIFEVGGASTVRE